METTTPAECAAARNAFTKTKLTEDFYNGIEKGLRPVQYRRCLAFSTDFHSSRPTQEALSKALSRLDL